MRKDECIHSNVYRDHGASVLLCTIGDDMYRTCVKCEHFESIDSVRRKIRESKGLKYVFD